MFFCHPYIFIHLSAIFPYSLLFRVFCFIVILNCSHLRLFGGFFSFFFCSKYVPRLRFFFFFFYFQVFVFNISSVLYQFNRSNNKLNRKSIKIYKTKITWNIFLFQTKTFILLVSFACIPSRNFVCSYSFRLIFLSFSKQIFTLCVNFQTWFVFIIFSLFFLFWLFLLECYLIKLLYANSMFMLLSVFYFEIVVHWCLSTLFRYKPYKHKYFCINISFNQCCQAIKTCVNKKKSPKIILEK